MDPISFLFWRFYYFFRDPKRNAPPGNVIVAPADGYILYVNKVESGNIPTPIKNGVPVTLEEWIGNPTFKNKHDGIGMLIGIYMAPSSVHYNRAPVSGRVASIINKPARGRNLSMSKALVRLLWDMPPYDKDSAFLTQNARNTVFIDGEIPVAVIRIADRYVSEIDCYVSEGDYVEKGKKIGMIRMGSQCDLLIPDCSRVKLFCKPKDKVFAGETVLAVY